MNTTNTKLFNSALESPPHWAGEKILPWDAQLFREMESFVSEKYWSSQQSINVFDVVGTAHPDYIGMTWLEFLQKGKRMAANLYLQESSPEYYLSESVKQPTMYFIAVDDDRLFVNGDGNHRTCISRFMFMDSGRTMLHGVTVEKYRVDRNAFESYQKLKLLIAKHRLPFIATPKATTISRDDTAGWMRERYSLQISVTDVERGVEKSVSSADLPAYVETLERRHSSGFFRKLISLFWKKP